MPAAMKRRSGCEAPRIRSRGRCSRRSRRLAGTASPRPRRIASGESARPKPRTCADRETTSATTALTILDGGPCEVGLESTIVDLSRGRPVLLRPGAIESARIEAVLGTGTGTGTSGEPGRTGAPRAPGTLAAHYAPRTPMELVPAVRLADRVAELASQGVKLAVMSRSRRGPRSRTGSPRRATRAATRTACTGRCARSTPRTPTGSWSNRSTTPGRGPRSPIASRAPTQRSGSDSDRPLQRHQDPAHRCDATRDRERRSRRRAEVRGPDDEPAARARLRAARQGGFGVPALGHDVQRDRDRRALPPRRRGDRVGRVAHRRLRGRRARGALRW